MILKNLRNFPYVTIEQRHKTSAVERKRTVFLGFVSILYTSLHSYSCKLR